MPGQDPLPAQEIPGEGQEQVFARLGEIKKNPNTDKSVRNKRDRLAFVFCDVLAFVAELQLINAGMVNLN